VSFASACLPQIERRSRGASVLLALLAANVSTVSAQALLERRLPCPRTGPHPCMRREAHEPLRQVVRLRQTSVVAGAVLGRAPRHHPHGRQDRLLRPRLPGVCPRVQRGELRRRRVTQGDRNTALRGLAQTSPCCWRRPVKSRTRHRIEPSPNCSSGSTSRLRRSSRQ